MKMLRKQQLKGTELELSTVCLGCGNFGEKLTRKQAFEILDAYVAAGGNFLDTANVYCRWVPGMDNISEQLIGQWLRERKAYNQVVVATKGGHYDFTVPSVCRVNKREISHDLDESLTTLGLERIDFYWLHRDNPSVPIEELVDLMEEFVRAGKIRYYGASNFAQKRLETARVYSQKKGITGFSAASNQFSLAVPNPSCPLNPDPTLVSVDRDFYSWHTQHKFPLIPYSSTASGFFEKLFKSEPVIKDGKLVSPEIKLQLSDALKNTYLNEQNLKIYETLLDMHEQYQVSLYSLSLACLVNQPFPIFPISSVRNTVQLEGLVAAGNLVLECEPLHIFENNPTE